VREETLRQLQASLPMPVAQLVRRALKAEPGLDRHNAAFYLGEVSLKLAASMRVGRWLDVAQPGSALAKKLEALVLPSLGTWCGILRDVGAALQQNATTRDGPVGRAHAGLERRLEGREALAELAREAEREGVVSKEMASQAGRGNVLAFFDLLVRYRNKVIGHGAQRSARFYERMGGLLLDALAAVLAEPALFADLRLCVAYVTAADKRRAVTRWTELTGLVGVVRQDPVEGARTGELYFVGQHGYRVLVHPLVVVTEDDRGHERFGFINEVAVRGSSGDVRRTEYLDYESGNAVASLDVAAELTGLLGRLRGNVVDTAAVRQTMAQVASVPPPALDEPIPPTDRLAPADHHQGDAVLVGEVVGGRYRLTKKLGEGAMGTVFAAEHVTLGRRFALKVLRPELAASNEMVARFEREAKEAAATRHPGIVDVIDLGRAQNGLVYLVMELLEGESVADRLARAQIPVDEAVWIVSGALDALAAAHARGIVHRDVKPDNLFITKDGRGNALVKVLDFGIAKVRDAAERMTASGAVLGTPLYMSPDQLKQGADVDARADVYSVGATLYHLLTAEPPVMGGSIYEVAAKVAAGDVERDPRKLRPDVPDWLAAVVERSMKLLPAERYATSAAMREALAAHATAWAGAPSPPSSEPRAVPSAPRSAEAAAQPSAERPVAADTVPKSFAAGEAPAAVPARSKAPAIAVAVVVLAAAGIGAAVYLGGNGPEAAPATVAATDTPSRSEPTATAAVVDDPPRPATGEVPVPDPTATVTAGATADAGTPPAGPWPKTKTSPQPPPPPVVEPPPPPPPPQVFGQPCKYDSDCPSGYGCSYGHMCVPR
jgi:eukaryotic-like serine/threonine-protein kinase